MTAPPAAAAIAALYLQDVAGPNMKRGQGKERLFWFWPLEELA
jgi:hypothetical protein